MDELGLGLHEILLLSDTNYLEKDVVEIKPDWDKTINSIHTFSQIEGLTMIDVRRRERKFF